VYVTIHIPLIGKYALNVMYWKEGTNKMGREIHMKLNGTICVGNETELKRQYPKEYNAWLKGTMLTPHEGEVLSKRIESNNDNHCVYCGSAYSSVKYNCPNCAAPKMTNNVSKEECAETDTVSSIENCTDYEDTAYKFHDLGELPIVITVFLIGLIVVSLIILL
jgi:uncharacterized protein (DUF983 family)